MCYIPGEREYCSHAAVASVDTDVSEVFLDTRSGRRESLLLCVQYSRTRADVALRIPVRHCHIRPYGSCQDTASRKPCAHVDAPYHSRP